MRLGWARTGDIAEDGHPCEAALEFRRAAVRAGIVEEVPADALDLAIAFAWLGKAVSRTTASAWWLATGTDPNTWQMVRALAADSAALAAAREAAESAAATPGHETELAAIRTSHAFMNAISRIKLLSSADERLSHLGAVARRLPGSSAVPRPVPAGVVRLADYRKPAG